MYLNSFNIRFCKITIFALIGQFISDIIDSAPNSDNEPWKPLFDAASNGERAFYRIYL